MKNGGEDELERRTEDRMRMLFDAGFAPGVIAWILHQPRKRVYQVLFCNHGRRDH